MNTCSDCGKVAKKGSISGTMEKTGEKKTLCWKCFENYELVEAEKENVFRKKKGGKE